MPILQPQLHAIKLAGQSVSLSQTPFVGSMTGERKVYNMLITGKLEAMTNVDMGELTWKGCTLYAAPLTSFSHTRLSLPPLAPNTSILPCSHHPSHYFIHILWQQSMMHANAVSLVGHHKAPWVPPSNVSNTHGTHFDIHSSFLRDEDDNEDTFASCSCFLPSLLAKNY